MNPTLWLYNCRDAAVTLEAFKTLTAELEEQSHTSFYINTVIPLQRAVMAMQARGMPVNREVLESTKQEYNDLVRLRHYECVQAAGQDFNPGSWPQVSQMLFEHRKYKPTAFTPIKGEPKVDELVIAKLRIKHPNDPLLKALLTYRRTVKAASVLKGIRLQPDGRQRGRWLLHGTRTWRLASRQPNFQNLSRDEELARDELPSVRGVYGSGSILEELGSFDKSQLELRLIAVASKCQSLLTRLATIDVHSYHTRLIYKLPPEAPIAKDGLERYLAKKFIYRFNYGGGADKMQEVILVDIGELLSLDFIQEVDDILAHEYPEIVAWRREMVQFSRRTRRSINGYDFKSMIFDPPADIPGVAQNRPIQSTAAFHINGIHLRLESRLGKLFGKSASKYGVVNQGHDSFLVFYPRDIRQEVLDGVFEEALRPTVVWGQEVMLPMDASIGRTWSRMKRVQR